MTNFSYMPIVIPDPPSPLRQVCYSENTQLIGPEGDPEGWHVLPPITIAGSLFDTRKVQVSGVVRTFQVVAKHLSDTHLLWVCSLLSQHQ